MSTVNIPAEVLNALRFYANGEHFSIDSDAQDFDTVSGEPGNWLHSQRDEDCTMIEDGGIARAVLQGKKIEEEAESQPVDGEIFSASNTPPSELMKAAEILVEHCETGGAVFDGEKHFDNFRDALNKAKCPVPAQK